MIRKAISIGVSAALLGSLLAVMIPSTALGASVAVTPTASIPRGNDYVGTASIAITESTVDEWSDCGFTLWVAIRDSASGFAVHFDESAGVAVGPDSLDPSFSYATIAGDRRLRVDIDTSNTTQKETLTISGLKILADPGAPLGPVQVRYLIQDDQSGGCSVVPNPTWNMGASTFTASGKLKNNVVGAVVGGSIILDSGSIPFVNSPPTASVAGALPETGISLSAVTAPAGGEQTYDATFAAGHNAGDPITQITTATCHWPPTTWATSCQLPSLGTVVDALVASTIPVGVQRGLINSQRASDVRLQEGPDPYLVAGAVVTLKLDPAAGVKFSGPALLTEHYTVPASGTLDAAYAAGANPIVVNRAAGTPPFMIGAASVASPTEAITVNSIVDNTAIQQQLTLAAGLASAHALGAAVTQHGLYFPAPKTVICDVSPDRLTLTCAGLPESGDGNSWIDITSIYLDVPTTAKAGGNVDVAITVGSLVVIPSSVTIAFINNTADATADSPQVIIGENDQQSGTVVIREAGAGLLGSNSTHNVLVVCYASHETFTRTPYLVVTAGDLKLRAISDPAVASGPAEPGTGVKGVLGIGPMGFACAEWIVYTKSTVASTLEIRGQAADGSMLGAGPAHGPQINVPHFLRPGPSIINLYAVGSTSWDWTGTEFAFVTNATRVFVATPVVVAVAKPEIFRGVPSQPAGDVTITETASHQFEASEQVLFSVVPNNLRDILPSVRFDTNRTTPVVSTNAASTGLIAHFQGYLNPVQFALRVDQRAFVPVVGAWVPGVITVSAMKYSTTNDAAYGAVSLEVCTPALVASTGMIDFETEALFGGIGLGLCFYRGLYGHDFGTIGDNVTAQQAHPGAWADFDQVVQNAKVVQEGLFPSMSVAAGYKFRETSPYKTFGTLVVAKGTYITNKVYVGAQFQGTRIEFWQRNGKTGTWVKRTTGRVDGKGYAYWSTIPPKLGGTGFARYVYYRAYFAGTDTVAAAFSQTMNRVLVQ